MTHSQKRKGNVYRRDPDGPYWLDYFDATGKRVRRSLETKILKEAKERRDAILSGTVELRWGTRDLDCKPAAFWTAYKAWAESHIRPETLKRVTIDWNLFLAKVKPRTLGAVTLLDVEQFKRDLIADGLAPRTINDALTRLHGLYARAVKLGLYKRGNPFSGIDRLPVEKTAPKWLTRSQLECVLKHARAHSVEAYHFIGLMAYAGMRFKEAVSARWEWFDFDRGTITIQADDSSGFKTKSKRFRSIPIHKELRAILEPQWRPAGFIIAPEKTVAGVWRVRFEPKRGFKTAVLRAEQELFPERFREVDGRLERIDKKAPSWCTPHTLRHTFASLLVQSGVDLYKVSVWLGHSDVRVTQIYSHLAPSDKDIDRL